MVEEQFELLLSVSVRNDDGHAGPGAAVRRHGPAAGEHSLGTWKIHSDWIPLYVFHDGAVLTLLLPSA